MPTTTHRRCVAAFTLLLAAAALCASVSSARAESVYKCRSADGGIAFQDRPCAASQSASVVEILPPPPPAPSPDYGRASRGERRSHAVTRAHVPERRELVSYECRAANGEVFYRHDSCPKQITAGTTGKASGKRAGKGAQAFAVSARARPRAEVCRELARAGAVGRAGHERDERVSTYDRNLGRDPCRRF